MNSLPDGIEKFLSAKVVETAYNDVVFEGAMPGRRDDGHYAALLRYYVVNKLLNAGINFKDAMAITGHMDVQSFMSYVKSTDSGRQKALVITRLNSL